MVKRLILVSWLTGQIDSELAEGVDINLRENYAGMYLRTFKILELIDRALCLLIGGCTDGKCDQYLVCVKAWIFVAKMVDLQGLDRPDGIWGDELYAVLDARHCL